MGSRISHVVIHFPCQPTAVYHIAADARPLLNLHVPTQHRPSVLRSVVLCHTAAVSRVWEDLQLSASLFGENDPFQDFISNPGAASTGTTPHCHLRLVSTEYIILI